MSQDDRYAFYAAHALAAIINKYASSSPWEAQNTTTIMRHARLANRYAVAMLTAEEEDRR